jgi:hypothetical protein
MQQRASAALLFVGECSSHVEVSLSACLNLYYNWLPRILRARRGGVKHYVRAAARRN